MSGASVDALHGYVRRPAESNRSLRPRGPRNAATPGNKDESLDAVHRALHTPLSSPSEGPAPERESTCAGRNLSNRAGVPDLCVC